MQFAREGSPLRLLLATQFLRQASLALEVARGRYSFNLASIVELTQAQLSVTSAEIENLNARYAHQIQCFALRFNIGLRR
jgi:outer membrane protein